MQSRFIFQPKRVRNTSKSFRQLTEATEEFYDVDHKITQKPKN